MSYDTVVRGGRSADLAPGAQKLETVHGGPGFVLQEFRCRVAAHTPGSEETPRAHQIVFVRSGLFVRETRRDRMVADPNQVLFFNAGEPYRVNHPLPGGDDCLVLSLPTEDLLDILAARDHRARDHAEAPFCFTHAPSTPRAAVLQRRLLTLARAGEHPPPRGASAGSTPARAGGVGGAEHPLPRGASAGSTPARADDGLELHEVAFDLAAEAIAAAPVPSPAAEGPRRAATQRDHRAAVEAVKILLVARLSGSPTLGEISRAIGYAPFHLARLFRRETGVPIHRYLIRLRLRLALERLAQDGEGLTSLALDLGFADHSHFTNAFRREFGVAPVRLRQRLSGRRLRQMRYR